jgi:nicotinamidase-related amidase
MKRLAALILGVALGLACTFPADAQSPISDEANQRHAEKAEKQRQKELKKSAKSQDKARKKNAKAQQKALKRSQQAPNR